MSEPGIPLKYAVTATTPYAAPVRAALMLASAILLGACAQTETKPRPAPPPVNLSGYSAAFKEGFKDGCDSARGSERRDDKRFGADRQYAQGWQDGKAICGKR